MSNTLLKKFSEYYIKIVEESSGKTFKIGNLFDKADYCIAIKRIAQAHRDHPNINQFKNKKMSLPQDFHFQPINDLSSKIHTKTEPIMF